MSDACHTMFNGEILNKEKSDYPLFYAVLYGNRISTAKFSKRLSCATKHLPIRVRFGYEYDTAKALEKGLRKDPTLLLDGEIFLEGLVEAEAITQAFENIIKKKGRAC